jgi:demethylmenaquinone methyltransferase/2-methoxy-6-polyprenyl-1,4-benzoquinol methylase
MPSQALDRRVPLSPHRALPEFYGDAANRARFVQELFDQGAPEYEWLSQLLSLWTDRYYRERALRQVGVRPGSKVLDVATGTGLMARAAVRCGVLPQDVVGLDPSRGMLRENRKRTGTRLVQGRGEFLPLASGVFDFVLMGYALRHVEDLHGLFREFHRVLCPGGKVLVLEIAQPSSVWGRRLLGWHLHGVIPALVRLCGHSRWAVALMRYYWATIAECVPPDTILAALRAAGFRDVLRRATGPVLSDYTAARVCQSPEIGVPVPT